MFAYYMLNLINYIGKRGKLVDGSVITTRWVCFFAPLFPLDSFRFWLGGKEPKTFYQRKLFANSLSVEIPLDWINVSLVYSVYLFIAAFASYLLQSKTFVIVFSVMFFCIYSLHVFLKYSEKKFYAIEKEKTFQCEKCKAKFNILKLNVKHKYFQCPKCKSVNSF